MEVMVGELVVELILLIVGVREGVGCAHKMVKIG